MFGAHSSSVKKIHGVGEMISKRGAAKVKKKKKKKLLFNHQQSVLSLFTPVIFPLVM